MASGRKEIAFDLDTHQLKKYYPNKNWRGAYEDIRKFMLDNGFEWRQGSVYVSKTGKPFSEISKVLNHLSKQHQWLNHCVRDCTVANIGNIHNQTYIFSDKKIFDVIQESKRVEEEFEF